MKRLFISERVDITNQFKSDPKIDNHVNDCTRNFEQKLSKPVGYSKSEIEGRFSRLRTQETNLGNLIADLLRTEL